MVVCTENIDSLIELSHRKLVVVVCDIGNKVCRDTILAHEDSVLFITEIGSSEPQRAVLFVGVTACLQLFDYLFHRAVIVQSAFSEPGIINNAVLFKVFVKSFDILRERKVNQRLASFLLALFGSDASELVIKALCVCDDIHTQINVIGHRELLAAAVFAVNSLTEILYIGILCSDSLSCLAANLHIAQRKRLAELFYLVARIVYIELSLDLVACLLKHRCKTVADSAAPCVAYVHRTCRVCRNELNKHSPALAKVCLSVAFLFIKHGFKHL